MHFKINRPIVRSHKPIKVKLLVNYKEYSKKVTATFGGIPIYTSIHKYITLITLKLFLYWFKLYALFSISTYLAVYTLV